MKVKMTLAFLSTAARCFLPTPARFAQTVRAAGGAAAFSWPSSQ